MTENIVVAGVRSPVRTSGPASAREAVVFVHGNPGSSEDWVDLLASVGGLARCIAPDMPGFGKADRPKSFEYTVPGYARHLAGVLTQLGVERAHLVLHDFGVPWGLYWASEHPQSVASVTLINCGIMPGYRWHKYARIWRTPGLGELMGLATTRRSFHWLLNRENPRPFPPAFLDRMFDDLTWGTKRAIFALYRATSAQQVGCMDIAERLRALALPALVLWGAADPNVPVRYAQTQREYFPAAEVHALPGCGHWPFIDEPARTASLLTDFLRRQLAAESARGQPRTGAQEPQHDGVRFEERGR